MSLRRSTGESNAGSGSGTASSGTDKARPETPWSSEEVAWFRRGLPTRWQGPRGAVALVGLFVVAAGYWGTVGYLVSGRLADPSDLVQFESSADFDGFDLRPVPGTIPWEWQSGAGGTSGPYPLGLARGVPHSLLIDEDGGQYRRDLSSFERPGAFNMGIGRLPGSIRDLSMPRIVRPRALGESYDLR